MKRIGLALIAVIFSVAPIRAGVPEPKKAIAFVEKFQQGGAFFMVQPMPNIRQAPSLKQTSSAIRALHYLGGELQNKEACAKFVASCFDAKSGGFSDTGTSKPDVFTTAVGLMAVTELKMPAEKYTDGALKFFSDNVQSFEDIRIAVAGLERLKRKAPKQEAWLTQVLKLQNADGTFGKGPGVARDTASSVVTILRLGAKAPQPDVCLKAIRDGQRKNGGWGKADDAVASDLETTYRVMRCFMMLKAKPADPDGVRSFVAKCRNADGGYGVAPGQPSSVGGTYFAAIVHHWLKDTP